MQGVAAAWLTRLFLKYLSLRVHRAHDAHLRERECTRVMSRAERQACIPHRNRVQEQRFHASAALCQHAPNVGLDGAVHAVHSSCGVRKCGVLFPEMRSVGRTTRVLAGPATLAG